VIYTAIIAQKLGLSKSGGNNNSSTTIRLDPRTTAKNNSTKSLKCCGNIPSSLLLLNYSYL
jgi:hypothetical protein